jgi:hypothetical protein
MEFKQMKNCGQGKMCMSWSKLSTTLPSLFQPLAERVLFFTNKGNLFLKDENRF